MTHSPLKTLLCYGDSNTFGHDPTSPLSARYPEDQRWTNRLQSVGWKGVNCGQNGRCIPVSDAELCLAAQQLHAYSADMIAVMLGTNDLLQSADCGPEDAAVRMEAFLRFLCDALPLAPEKLLLIAPPAMQRGSWVADEATVSRSLLLGSAYDAVAKSLGTHFANAACWLLPLGADGVHLTQEGHARFAHELCHVLAAMQSARAPIKNR